MTHPLTRRRVWLTTLRIGLVGLLATLGASAWLSQRIESDAQAAFDRVAARVAQDISRRFSVPVYGLRGLAGTYAATPQMTAQAFRAYVQARDLDREFPGLRGFGLIERVPQDDLPAWLAAAQAEQLTGQAEQPPGLAVHTLGAPASTPLTPPTLPTPTTPRYLVRHLEPAERNPGATGLDVGHEPQRRAAIERAIDTGNVALSDPVTLLHGGQSTPGFVVYLPIYRTGSDPGTPAQRRAALRGVLYAPLVTAELLREVRQGVAAGHAEFRLTADATVVDAEALALAQLGSGHRRARTVDVLDRRFGLVVQSTPAFEATIDRSPVWLAVGAGLVITLLLGVLARASDTARWRAERRLEDMTGDLQRLAAVARATGDAVMLLDPQRRIVWVNDAFTRNTGFTLEEALGQQPSRLLGSESARAQGLSELRTAIDAGHAYRAELRNRRKDGSLYWTDVEIQPQHDAAGAITGWIAVESDITQRRDAEAALAAALRDNRALLDTIHQHAIVSIADRHGRIVEVNDAFCRITGYAREELLGQDHRILSSGHHPPGFWQAMWRRLAAGQSWRAEVCNRAKDGSLHWVDSIVAPFLDAEGVAEKYVSVRFDVTAARQGVQDLARERERLVTILAGTGAGTWEHDYTTGTDTLNEAYARMLGETLDSLAMGPGGFMARVHPDDLPRLRAANLDHAQGRTADYQCEFRMRHRSGAWVWVQSRGRIAERDAQGRPLRMAGIHLDVSERHAQHQALEQAHAAMRTIFENLPCAVSVFGPDLRLTASNPQFRSVLDFPDRLFETPAPHYESFVRFNAERGEYGAGNPDDIVAEAMTRIVGVTVQPHQFERTRPNGTVIEVRGAPMPGGGFVTTYIDVTQERAAKLEAERARNLLLGAIETIDEAFAIYGPDDRLVLCNERYRQVYADVADLIVPGVQFESLIRSGAERGGYAQAHGRVDEWVRERMARHLAADADHLQPLSDGRTLRILERRLPDGHIVGFRIDVTELVRARESAEAASHAKSQFLANMSHEIRTPMNAILGLLKLLRRSGLDARQDDYAGKVEGAARSLLALLNDILDFSKVEAGKMELDPQPFRVGSLLRDVQVLLESVRGDKRLDLRFQVDPDLPVALVGDALRLQQVLINLGGNALKFTERGEVVLAVRVLDDDGQQVRLRLSVRDTGIGIAPEHQARIFSGFTQAEASTTRRFGGTGLGVAISQRLVALMGGELHLQSQPGQGSRFWFDIALPHAADDAAVLGLAPSSSFSAASGDTPQGTGRLAALRLLVAEDNPTNQQVAKELLEGEGAVVVLAHHGQQALESLAEDRFDAVLMDLQMPVLDGLDATRALRAAGHRLPVIGLTANAMAQDRQACLSAGMDAHVGKPFDLDRLVALLRRLTGRESAPAAGRPDKPSPPQPASHAAAAGRDDAAVCIEAEAEAEAAGVALRTALQRFGGRTDVYLDAYLDFVTQGLDALPLDTVDPADPAELRRAVHSLKGLAATLGVEDLAAAAATAEAQIAAAQGAGGMSAVSMLRAAIDRRRDPLRALAQRLVQAWRQAAAAPVAPGLTTDPSALADALSRLRQRLDAADMEALDLVDQLLTEHGPALGSTGLPLQRAVHRLDFATALAMMAMLKETAA